MNMKEKVESSVNEFYLNQLINKACLSLNTDSESVIKNLLTESNKADILSGQIPMQTLRCHIQTWISDGYQKVN